MVLLTDEQTVTGIGQLLIMGQLLEKTDVLELTQLAITEQTTLQHYLVKNNILSARQIAYIVAQYFELPIMDLDCVEIAAIPIQLLDEQYIYRHLVIPLFRQGNHLFLAIDDPGKHSSLKEIEFHTGLIVYPIIVETDKLISLVHRLLTKKENEELFILTNNLAQYQSDEEHADFNATDDIPVITLVDKIIHEAIRRGASDIHFEIYEKEFRIRYRQDGILHQIATLPTFLSTRIAARIKVMSHLDISEKRIPQDGGFKKQITPTHSIDFRVSTCPIFDGEKIVVRILDPNVFKLETDALGFNPHQKLHFIHAINRPQGMILVTGPTGSGKTVSLYTALNLLNTTKVNISTVEDPVEIKLSGINQVTINSKAGLTFSTVLRSFLRQDPDIIMVGEIRDFETADISLKAAQTGHLVLSTLHTNSATETLDRLIGMGIPSFNIASSVTLIMAQRLARKLCEQCKTPRHDITHQNLIELGFAKSDVTDIKLYQANSCNQCIDGYKGRVGLFEVLPITKKISQFIMSGKSACDILKEAQKEGMITIFQSGLEKVKQGITSIEEINRVTVD